MSLAPQAVLMVGTLLAGMVRTAAAGGATAGSSEPWYRAERSIAYGSDDVGQQLLNAYLPPPSETLRAAVLYFHGGSFVAGSPMDASHVARFLTGHGYATFLVG